MSLIYKASLLRWQRCNACPGAPKGCSSCGSHNYYRSSCCKKPACVQVPLDNRIVFTPACYKKPCHCQQDEYSSSPF